MNHMTIAYIGLGSNIGSSKKVLDAVLKVFANHEKFCMPIVSSYYQTSPVSKIDQDDFLNAVVKVDTSFTSGELLKFLLALEKAVGRKRDPEKPDGPRIIDCDLLLYGREESNTIDLTVPHPRMTDRLFVMEPLLEIAPKAFIPGYGYAKDVFEELDGQNHYDSQTVSKLDT